MSVRLTLIIDTDKYAGNWEREMAYYMTGQQAEYMPGGIKWLEAIVDQEKPMLDGLLDYRPTNNGTSHVQIVGTPHMAPKDPTGKGRQMAAPYNSVAIFLSARPSEAEMATLKERAEKFTKLDKIRGYQIHITGFRLVTSTTAESVEDIK